MKLLIDLQNYDEDFSVDEILDDVDGTRWITDNWLDAQHLSTGIGNKLRWKTT
jgi:hypothetical protein